MPVFQSHLAYLAAWTVVAAGTFLATTVAGLEPAQLIQANIAINVAMFGFILRNTVQISKLQGRYGADHSD